MITDEILEPLRVMLVACEDELKQNPVAVNHDYNKGWIEALDWAIKQLESFGD